MIEIVGGRMVTGVGPNRRFLDEEVTGAGVEDVPAEAKKARARGKMKAVEAVLTPLDFDE